MTTPYRTAPATPQPRAPWWRRALCAVGSHSLYLVSDHCARCEHCTHETRERLSFVEYCRALSRAFGQSMMAASGLTAKAQPRNRSDES